MKTGQGAAKEDLVAPLRGCPWAPRWARLRGPWELWPGSWLGRRPCVGSPQLSPDCLALHTSLSCPLGPPCHPLHLSFLSYRRLALAFLSPWSLLGWPCVHRGDHALLSALVWAGRSTPHDCFPRSQSQVTAEQAAVDDAHECSSLPGSRLQLHLPAQLLASDLPSCHRGMVFQNPILEVQEITAPSKHRACPTVPSFPRGGLSEQDLKGQVSTLGRCSGHISHPRALSPSPLPDGLHFILSGFAKLL